jgi:hypothetical protein
MDTRVQRVAANFIKKRGKEKFLLLIKMLEDQVSGEFIAQEFSVSRERVRQWKELFGQTVSTFWPLHGLKELAWTHESETPEREDRALPDDQ